MPTPLATAKAIARALRAARRAGQTPEAIILSPELGNRLQTGTLYYVRRASTPCSMFDVPVEIDADIEGWTIRVAVP